MKQERIQINFPIDQNEKDTFKMLLASEGKKMSGFLRESVRNYIESKTESQAKTA